MQEAKCIGLFESMAVLLELASEKAILCSNFLTLHTANNVPWLLFNVKFVHS